MHKKIVFLIFFIAAIFAGIFLYFEYFIIIVNAPEATPKISNLPSISPSETPEIKDVLFSQRASQSETSFFLDDFTLRANKKIQDLAVLDVPFTAQAPTGDWNDMRQEDGCEEAAALMAMCWVRGCELNPTEAEKEIIAISDFELKNYGNYKSANAEDTADRIFKGYFNYEKIEVRHNITIENIKIEISKGNLVIVPANGRKLQNPHYKNLGPLEHNLVIKGHDMNTKEFITNDSGTKFGESYRYKEEIIANALWDYPTTGQLAVENQTAMIVVYKP